MFVAVHCKWNIGIGQKKSSSNTVLKLRQLFVTITSIYEPKLTLQWRRTRDGDLPPSDRVRSADRAIINLYSSFDPIKPVCAQTAMYSCQSNKDVLIMH